MNAVSKTWITTLLLYFGIGEGSYAQSDNLRFENLSDRRGLPKISINSILQDQEGFMWFGTSQGLYRFDGHTATIVFQHDPNDPEHSLPSSIILDMHEDHQGRFWIGSPVGLLQLDKRTGKALIHRPDSSKASRWNGIRDILEDREGILWLGTGEGIARFDPDTGRFLLYPSPMGGSVSRLKEDNAGSLWSITNGGLSRFHILTGKFAFYPPPTQDGRQSYLFSLSIDSAGIAWVGSFGDGLFRMDTRTPGQYVAYNPGGALPKTILKIYQHDGYIWLAGDGLQRINPRTNKVIDYRSDNSLSGKLRDFLVSSLCVDRLGNLWIGTHSGVSKASIRTSPFYNVQITPAPEGFRLSENRINSILEDHTGTVWIASNKKGLCKYDRSTHQITPVIVNPTDSRNSLENQEWPLVEDGEGRLWVGTDLDNGLYVLDRTTGRFTRHNSKISIRRMAIAPSGKIWLGCHVNGIAAFDPATNTFTYYPPTSETNGIPLETFVTAILVSRSEEVWVSTWGSGLIRLNPTTGKFTRYAKVQAPEGYVNELSALDLYEDSEGIIWIGSLEGGLIRLDPNTHVFTYFTTREGLPSNCVTSIVGDEQGNLWLGTKSGLSRFNPITNTFLNFDESDGLPDNDFVGKSIYQRKGSLFLGTSNGFVIFHPDSIRCPGNLVPIYITGLKVMEKPIPLSADEIELAFEENFISFDFTAINFDSPEKTRYAYQLIGVDRNWVETGNRFANYTDLRPGSYTFRVKASTDNYVWNEAGMSIEIVIRPPWWQTWWAYGLYSLLGIGFLFGIIHYSVSRERLQSDLKLQRMEAEKMHEIDHLKSRFFANISHEFRTPLTLILGPLEKFISRTSAESPDKSVYQTMQRNANRLLSLINQLLDLSKLEAGRLKLEAKPAAIFAFLKTIVLSFTSLAERRQIQYHFQYPTENPVVYFDADKLDKIITNLLSNAFKFTTEGGEITVSVRMLPAKDQRLISPVSINHKQPSKVSTLELSVTDNGIGIPKDQLDKIFDRFYQTDNSHTGKPEGSGIGLALVRELVELHGGEIVVESDAGEGTCFTVLLPLAVADLEEIVIAENTLAKGQQSLASLDDGGYELRNLLEPVSEGVPLILIVEDNADIRHFIRENLHPDYKVVEAADGEQGYTLALELIPDLILSDVMMPKMEGVELCRKLKEDKKTDHIPVILLTAKASGESKIEGLETGADDYIIKPFEASELLVRIKNLIEGRKRLKERFSREITLQPSSIAITSRDEKLLQHVLQIVEKHMADSDFGVEAFCREAGMSPSQLHRKLKVLTDQSPGDFIRIMRLKRAVELLTHTAGSIAEVSYQVGFNDPSYFTKCFQKQFGKTPSAFIAEGSEKIS